jgi:hypothetical protein
MDRVESKSIWFLLPTFADEFEGREAAESLEPFGEVVGSDEVAEVGAQLVVAVIVVALNRGLFDGAVHPLHLTVGPEMIRLGEPMVDAVQKTDPVKRMAAKARCWSPSIFWKISELDTVVGEHGVNPIRNSCDQRLQESCSCSHVRTQSHSEGTNCLQDRWKMTPTFRTAEQMCVECVLRFVGNAS